MILLSNGIARAEVHPEAGGAIGRFDILRNGDWVPVFQTAPSAGRDGPFALGSNLLVPFSNRISGGGFTHEGRFYPLERNAGDPYPIHGSGFALPWTIADASLDAATLKLTTDGPGPFRYEAVARFSLAEGALTMSLVVRNLADVILPYGAGFHPWFARTPQTTLAFGASGYWTETADHLPDRYVSMDKGAALDFAAGREVPGGFINNAFTGWNGQVTLTRPEDGVAIELVAPPPLTTLIVYSPSAAADFICLEPVSHSVDAHNRADPGTAPPQVLVPGEELAVETTISASVLR